MMGCLLVTSVLTKEVCGFVGQVILELSVVLDVGLIVKLHPRLASKRRRALS